MSKWGALLDPQTAHAQTHLFARSAFPWILDIECWLLDIELAPNRNTFSHTLYFGSGGVLASEEGDFLRELLDLAAVLRDDQRELERHEQQHEKGHQEERGGDGDRTDQVGEPHQEIVAHNHQNGPGGDAEPDPAVGDIEAPLLYQADDDPQQDHAENDGGDELARLDVDHDAAPGACIVVRQRRHWNTLRRTIKRESSILMA